MVEVGPLRPGTIHLWFLDRNVPTDPRWHEVLDPEEQARAAALRTSKLRDDFIAAHALVRSALSAYGDHPPGDWKFETEPGGRPSVSNAPAGLRFSLTHAGSRAALALAFDHPLGLDLEEVRPEPDPLPLARRFFTASEALALGNLPQALRSAAFTSLWTVKEAVLKAQGFGLSVPLHTVEVEVDSAGRPRKVRAPGGPWSVHSWSPEPDFCAALAVASEQAPRISVFIAAPLKPPVPAPELGPDRGLR